MRASMLFVVSLWACSSGPSTAPTAGGAAAGASPGTAVAPAAGQPIAVDGELAGCDPVGIWRGRGAAAGGDCADGDPAVTIEAEIAREHDGFRIAVAGEANVVPDRLAAIDGHCAVGFELRRRDGDGEVVLFVHLVDGGPAGAIGRGARDRYRLVDGARQRVCSQPVELAVSRAARSGE